MSLGLGLHICEMRGLTYPTSSAGPVKGALGDGASSFISWFYLDMHFCPLMARGIVYGERASLLYKDCPVSPSLFLVQ